MVKRYPVQGLVPHGWYHLRKGSIPMLWLEAHDKSIIFDLMGGRSIVDRRYPESVQVAKDGISGLIPPWRTIDQKGASQDGVTFLGALYDPCEVAIDAVACARDREHLRVVVRDLIASIDAVETAELHWWTFDAGHWWAPLRWFKTPPGALNPGAHRRQPIKLVLRADNAFWRGQADVDSWGFSYEKMSDPFSYVTGGPNSTSLGPSWPLRYTGFGGWVSTDGSKAIWNDLQAPMTQTREVIVGPFKDFSTATDFQVVTVQTGSSSEPAIPESSYNDVWGRMGRNADGTWNGWGIRFRVGWGYIELARFTNYAKTVMYSRPLIVTPLIGGDEWRLLCGVDDDPRLFRVMRNGFELFSHKEKGTSSALGPTYRGSGWGMSAAAALVSQATPASVKKVSAGDNSVTTQSGWLWRTNNGDQPMHDEYTVFGPGTARFWLGPGAGPDDYVEFGPLLPNQVVHIITDPNGPKVIDMTAQQPTPQEQNVWEKALAGFLNFIGGGANTPLSESIKSQWGILPPQGNLFSLLKGRWNKAAAIPPRSPGDPLKQHAVKVSISGGTATSRIVASGIPLRRYPL